MINQFDLLVKTDDPLLLDLTLQQAFGAFVVEIESGYLKRNGCYVVRMFRDQRESLKFYIKLKRLGEVIDEPKT